MRLFSKHVDPVKAGILAAHGGGQVDTSKMQSADAEKAILSRANELKRMQQQKS